MSFEKVRESLASDLDEIKSAGLWKTERNINSNQTNLITLEDGQHVTNMCANNYLGLANDKRIIQAAKDSYDSWGYGLASVRFICGTQTIHKTLEKKVSEFLGMEETILYAACFDANGGLFEPLFNAEDAIISDSLNHASIIDGVRLHMGKRFTYKHNDIESLEKNLDRATKMAEQTGGGILVITEGVFGMRGEQGKLKEIAALKSKYNFRLLVDDAHGFGTLGKTGAGAGEEQGVQDQIDVYFATFAKSMAGIGAFLAADQEVIDYLKYNLRSQMFAKSLPMIFVKGGLKRLELLRSRPELKDKLWENVNALQNGLRERGFDLGTTTTCVTPVYLKGSIPEAMALVKDLRENYGIFCSIVVYPVIPKGLILLRLIPTAVHTMEDIQITLDAFSSIRERLENGTYQRLSAAVAAQMEG